MGMASLPAKIPDSVTNILDIMGVGALYSYIGQHISNTAIVEVRYDNISFKLETDLGNPTRKIRKHGVYEKPVTEKVINELAPDKVFLNVGSSFGYFPLLAAHITDPRLVHGLEPNPETLAIFQRNNEKITDGKVNVRPYFVGADDGEVTRTLTIYSGLPAGDAKEVVVTRQQTTVDSYVQKENISPDLLLVDIDGGEYELIKGAERVLRENGPDLLIELHPEILIDEYGVTSNEITSLLNEYGYRFEYAETYDNNEAEWKKSKPSTNKPYHLFAYANY